VYFVLADAHQSTDSVHKEKEEKEVAEDYIGIIIGALAALIVLLVFIIVIFFIRHKRRKHNNNRRSLKPVVDRHVTINLNDLRGSTNGKVSNGNMYNSIATDETNSERELLCGGGGANGTGPIICNGSLCNGNGSLPNGLGGSSGTGSDEKLSKTGYLTPKDSIQGRLLLTPHAPSLPPPSLVFLIVSPFVDLFFYVPLFIFFFILFVFLSLISSHVCLPFRVGYSSLLVHLPFLHQALLSYYFPLVNLFFYFPLFIFFLYSLCFSFFDFFSRLSSFQGWLLLTPSHAPSPPPPSLAVLLFHPL
jgi:hypothetical protein